MLNFTRFASALTGELAKSGIRPYANFANTTISDELFYIALFKQSGTVIYTYVVHNADKAGKETGRLMEDLARRHISSDGFRSVVLANIFVSTKDSGVFEQIKTDEYALDEQIYVLNYGVSLTDEALTFRDDAPHELMEIIPVLKACLSGEEEPSTGIHELVSKYGNFKNAHKKAEPLLVYVIMLINIMLFALMEMNGGSENVDVLLAFGAMNGKLVADGQFFRLVSAMFLHSGIAHIAMNSLSLYIFGARVEKYFGKLHFFVVFLLSGIVSSTFAGFLDPSSVMVGASGAIFGLSGAALMITYFKRKEIDGLNKISMIFLIVSSLSFGFIYPNVSNTAHISGLVFGLIYGLCYFVFKRDDRK